MRIQRFNWQIWAGFVLSVFAFFSFFFFFVRFPITRDFPWANLLLFSISVVLLIIGVRRSFAPYRSRLATIGGLVLAALGLAIFGFFIYSSFVMSRRLPRSQGAPQIGQKAPDFTLNDTGGEPRSLSQLLGTPINGKAPKGVLLIFYRGDW